MTETAWPWSRAVVVGASSGIGEAMARQLATRGCRVALVARREDRLATIRDDINRDRDAGSAEIFVHDVRDTEAVESLFQEIATMLGGLDLVVYASGIMPRVRPDEYPTDRDIETIEVNFGGAVAWLNQAAMRFERAGAGTIVGVSSVAGDRGRRRNPVYNATKAGLNTYLDALRNRLAIKGVTVLSARPGYVRTALIEGLKLPRFVPVPEAPLVATQILDAAALGQRVVYVPSWLRWVMLLVRAIPAPIFERLNF
jgi:decaprenylphospho-beta-D-erythro-pentofuranosid-2-ulose 2-reductase